MMEAFVLNPPRRRARRSRKRGRRRRRRNAPAASYGINRPRRKRRRKSTGRRRRRRSSSRRRRRRNPVATYGLNQPRRRRRRVGWSRRAKPSTYGMTRRRRNPAGAAALQVIPFRVPMKGILGKVANGIVQGAAGGAVVFGGYYVSGKLVSAIEGGMGETMAGPWRRPLLFGATAGIVGTIAAFVAPRGKKALWTLLAASGPGLRMFGGLVANLIPAEQTGIVGEIRNMASGLADYLQVGEELDEAGLGTEEEVYEAGMEDFLQVGEESEEEEEEVFV